MFRSAASGTAKYYSRYPVTHQIFRRAYVSDARQVKGDVLICTFEGRKTNESKFELHIEISSLLCYVKSILGPFESNQTS